MMRSDVGWVDTKRKCNHRKGLQRAGGKGKRDLRGMNIESIPDHEGRKKGRNRPYHKGTQSRWQIA